MVNIISFNLNIDFLMLLFKALGVKRKKPQCTDLSTSHTVNTRLHHGLAMVSYLGHTVVARHS